MGWDLTIVATVVVGYAAFSGRLHGSAITPAMVFVGAGYLLGDDGIGWFDSDLGASTVRLLAEVTLALVLFTDASALDTRALSHETSVPARLLAVGLPLTIVVGALVAIALFSSLGVFEALVLAVLLAPTDAALGQSVVSDTRLPSPVRQGLSVESGLNDGVCVPLLFAAVAFAELDRAPTFDGEIVVDLLKEVFIALAVGAAVAVVVSVVVIWSRSRNWLDDVWEPVVPLAAAAMAYTATAELGGSGFIGCFVAGLVYGRLLGSRLAHRSTKLTEEIGGVLSAVTFFVFGTSVIGPALTDLDAATIAYAVLSLTVIRMVPVAVSLIGAGAAPATMAFVGWFGPRGLATIVFMLTVVEESDLPATGRIVEAATLTVLMSVVAHGVSAAWLTGRYVRWCAAGGDGLAVASPASSALPLKRNLWHRRSRQSS